MNEQNNEMSSQAQETIPNPPKRKRNGLFTLFPTFAVGLNLN